MMRPTSPATSDRRSGFLLVEVLVTFAIIALVAAIVFPRLAATSGAARLKASAYDVAGVLRSDRTSAIRSGRMVVTGINLRERRVRSGQSGTVVGFPDDVGLNVSYAANEATPGVRFFPNGSASGAQLTIRSRVSAYDVKVDWFTGAVTIEGPHAP